MEGQKCSHCEKKAKWLPKYERGISYCDDHWPYKEEYLNKDIIMNDKVEHKASPEMQLFFEKLLKLKSFVYEKSMTANSEQEESILNQIYSILDELIKEP